MEFHLYEKVRLTKDVKFVLRRGLPIIIKRGTIGVIIDICRSMDDESKIGYTLELPEYSDFDPTFTFSEDCLELVK